jgi:hypothetical protein
LARHGILYPSRLEEERVIALYERVLDKVRALVKKPMIELRKELAAVIDRLALAMV